MRCLHLLNFVGLDYFFDFQADLQDAVLNKPYIVAGLACAAHPGAAGDHLDAGLDAAAGAQLEAAAPLGVCGRVLAVLHFLWQAKAAERWEPLLYAVGLGLLLFVRIPACATGS